MDSTERFAGNALDDLTALHAWRESQRGEVPACVLYGAPSPDGQMPTVPISHDVLSRHMMLLGGIGTGKTNAFLQIVYQLRHTMTPDDVMIIFDTKGDFYENFPPRPGDVVISNDKTARGPDGDDYWNIFREIEDGPNREESILEISTKLFQEKIDKTQQPFFPIAARDVFAAILTGFVRKRDRVQLDNQVLRRYLDSATTAEIRKHLESHADLRSVVNYISGESQGQTQGVMSELMQVVREIFIGNFRRSGSLSLRDLVRSKGGKVVFIEYDIGIGQVLTPIYSMMFDLALKEALSRKKSEGKVYFIADEFRLLPSLLHVEDAVNFGRSLGVKCLIGIQNVEQIFEGYGPFRARSILSGFLTSIAFRVNDATSRHYVQGLHGKNRKRETYTSALQSRLVESVHDAWVVEDWDISRLRDGEAIIGLPGQPPFRFHFRKYEKPAPPEQERTAPA
ncbi:MAG: type IV secretion system DNA-binding domain-containing protein [Micrococcales bacterium]|nr:type IV secretion system DNA-binding domain-containing protein [Micrococcales bacterium]